MRIFYGFLLACVVASSGCEDRSASSILPFEGGATRHQISQSLLYSSSQLDAKVEEADLSVLFLGNSHSYHLPKMMNDFFARHHPELKVHFQPAPGSGFLVEQSQSEHVLAMIENHSWDYVVLQAQKYSTSGKFNYPNDGAVKLASLARSSGARVVMYPEFPRRGVDEYARIRAVHESIAKEVEVDIAPIGEAWELAKAHVSEQSLYQADGNHASSTGNYLITAVIFHMVCPPDLQESKAAPQDKLLWEASQNAFDAAASELNTAADNETPEVPSQGDGSSNQDRT